METKTILLVEDNADDEALTFRALMKNNISNQLVVVRDGAEALDYLFATGKYSGRDVTLGPQVVLLDLNLPKVNGLEVLRQLRANQRTKLLPVVILTSSNEDQDRITVRPDLLVIFSTGYTAEAASPSSLADQGASFLQKPYSMKNLGQTVRDSLDRPRITFVPIAASEIHT